MKQESIVLQTAVELTKVMARACGHHHIRDFEADDLTTFKPEMATLAGVAFGGVGSVGPAGGGG